MKNFFLFLTVIIIAYSIYYDLTIGTLQISTATAIVEEGASHQEYHASLPFVEKEVKRGDTVLSIEENIHEGPLPVSIEQMIKDFQLLNGPIEPNQIQIHKKYKFPVYK